jgi:hypothetical protein
MGRGSEGKGCLIKNNMLGDDDVVGGEIVTPITFVINGVSEEDTMSGLGANLWVACTERLGYQAHPNTHKCSYEGVTP